MKNLNRVILSFLAGFSVAAVSLAQDHTPIPVWPGAAPDEPGTVSREKVLAAKGPDTAERIHFVDRPTLTPYHADDSIATGCAVVICPGGGYNILAWPKEGLEVAEWLNSLGVSAFVLKYRVPRRDKESPQKWPLQDAQRAIRLVRQHAGEWNIDTARIGMLGFSAGGNLTVHAATRWNETTYDRIDAADDLSCRPDFMIPIYAAYLGDPADDSRLNPSLNISKQTPPAFMAVTWDDKMRGAHSALLFAELKKAGVHAELHVFSKGGHGYGLRPTENPVAGWPRLCADWLRVAGLLDRANPRQQSPSK